MDTEKVTIIGKHGKPIPPDQISKLADTLGITLPIGYVDFMQAFGEGLYADLFRIYPPDRILNEYEERRQWWQDSSYEDLEGNRHWFFRGSEDILNPDQLQESFIIGDTLDGDNLVFYPPDPDHIYILPRHDDLIFTTDSHFDNLHTLWNLEGGQSLLRIFQPLNSQEHLRRSSEDYNITQAILLAQIQAQWGETGVLVSSKIADDWSWHLVAFVPTVGGRFQILHDEGVTREIVTEYAITTIHGNGQRRMVVTIECGEDSVTEINTFLDDLEKSQLVNWKL
ncbi:MAG: SMI1/KNR4 family protein [Aggregatilineales bacterium]